MSKKGRMAWAPGEREEGRIGRIRTYRNATPHQASISSLGHHRNPSFVAIGKEGRDLLRGARLKHRGTCGGFPFPGPVLSVGGEKVIVVGGGGGEE